MKIIFLDIDGVLNNSYTKTRTLSGTIGIHLTKAAMINNILLATGAHIVLSSTWRRNEGWQDDLRIGGILMDRVLGATPILDGEKRGVEIQRWIEEHPEIIVERFAILDDGDDMLPEQPLFQTTWKIGLTGVVAQHVIDHLNKGGCHDQTVRKAPTRA